MRDKKWLNEKQEKKIIAAFDKSNVLGFKTLQKELAKTGFYDRFFK